MVKQGKQVKQVKSYGIAPHRIAVIVKEQKYQTKIQGRAKEVPASEIIEMLIDQLEAEQISREANEHVAEMTEKAQVKRAKK